MVYLGILICLSFIAGVLSSQDPEFKTNLSTSSYVNGKLKDGHYSSLGVSWSDRLQQRAELERDRALSERTVMLDDTITIIQLSSRVLYLLTLKRDPVVIRTVATEYVDRKANLINKLKTLNVLAGNGHVGCSMYHSGDLGRIFCVYGFW